jgi:carbon monoxide dehydrogenase subunit G
MRFTDVRRVAARRAEVWDALHDRDALAESIPGCERLIPLGDGEYVAIMAVRSHTFRCLLTVADTSLGSELTVTLDGRGRSGTLEAAVEVKLDDGPMPDMTSLAYDARVHFGVRSSSPARSPLAVAGQAVSRFFRHLDGAVKTPRVS